MYMYMYMYIYIHTCINRDMEGSGKRKPHGRLGDVGGETGKGWGVNLPVCGVVLS
jgi:hypothetical protein